MFRTKGASLVLVRVSRQTRTQPISASKSIFIFRCETSEYEEQGSRLTCVGFCTYIHYYYHSARGMVSANAPLSPPNYRAYLQEEYTNNGLYSFLSDSRPSSEPQCLSKTDIRSQSYIPCHQTYPPSDDSTCQKCYTAVRQGGWKYSSESMERGDSCLDLIRPSQNIL